MSGFNEVTSSVKPEHFAIEDRVLLASYATTVLEERSIAARLAKLRAADSSDFKAEISLSAQHNRVVGSMIALARALRLGPKSRHGGAQLRRASQGQAPTQAAETFERDEAPAGDPRPWRQ